MKKTTACVVTALVVLGCVLAIGAATYVGVPKGQLYHAYVTYSDADTVVVKPGYGECNGHYFEFTSDLVYDVNYIPTGEDFIYIYIDDDQSDYPYPTICDSITEPVWSDSKLGWYNGNDRCIGVVWTPAGSATIETFSNNSNQLYAVAVKTVLSNGNPTGGNLEFLEASAYIPVNAIGVKIRADNTHTNGIVTVVVGPYDNPGGGWLNTMAHNATRLYGWIELTRNSSRDLSWWGNNDDNNLFNIAVTGYQIER
jgi:hypothetical protein